MNKVLKYQSTTNFNPRLNLDVTETKEEQHVTYLFESFPSRETAINFSLWWEDVQGWAYMPQAQVVDNVNGTFSVKCRRRLSSD